MHKHFYSQLPFALVASLNGVAMFGQTQDITLISTSDHDCKLLWKDYHNRWRGPFNT